MTAAIQVVTTIDTEEGATRLARMLVERRLAACVQIALTETQFGQFSLRWIRQVREIFSVGDKARRERFDRTALRIKRTRKALVQTRIAALQMVEEFGPQRALDELGETGCVVGRGQFAGELCRLQFQQQCAVELERRVCVESRFRGGTYCVGFAGGQLG